MTKFFMICFLVVFTFTFSSEGAGQQKPIPKLSPYEAAVIAVIQEAQDESLYGKIVVAGTILDRANDPAWPDTEHQVVYQPWQYPGIQKDMVSLTDNQLVMSRWAVAMARRGVRPCGLNVFWYHNTSIKKPKKWGLTIKFRCQLGNHIFYGR